MSKIVKNTTISPYSITDTGVTIPASDQYVIPSQDYLIWAASSNVITGIGSGDLVINDGSVDLSISDGSDLIKGIFPKKIYIKGATDDTDIGNVDDKLKVYDESVINILNTISNGLGLTTAGVFKQNELAITSRSEVDLSGTTYTVTAGKKFLITALSGSYDAQASLYIRLKKQTGGVGDWVTQFRLNMMSGGQGNSTLSFGLGNGVLVGDAGDVFKITIEASIAKGTVWAGFSGSEI